MNNNEYKIFILHCLHLLHSLQQIILVMMISLELVDLGWAIIIGRTKRQFQTANLLEVDSKLEFLLNKHFTSCNVSKCPCGS
jgi:hypothetical protein